ncbi:MAG: DUF2279 domain-containing protein [Bacteroidota bacterium]
MRQISRFFLITSCTFWMALSPLQSQDLKKGTFWEPADTFHPTRFWTAAGIGASAYTATMIGLAQVWYADFSRTNFQFFNDWREWNGMDKAGHAYATYLEATYSYRILRWTGMKQRKAAWMGVGLATIFQTSLETLDGFSAEWGFSPPDIAFNTLGAGLFISQELLWAEQRLTLKLSSNFPRYPDVAVPSLDGGHTSTLQDRAEALYGGGFAARLLKDYNAQTIWLSANVAAFLTPQNRFPPWLNLAVGYGAQNLYGGFHNEWETDGVRYRLDPLAYPRYRQFYLSLDLDLSRIPVRNAFLRSLLRALNVIKIPAPTLEINTTGQLRFHPLFF